MPRDPVIPQWAIDQRARQHRRDREFMGEFVPLIASLVPHPTNQLRRAEPTATCGAFGRAPQIRQFIASYGTDHALFPGVLDTPGYPTLEEFVRDVGTLAEGEYARSLPKKEMLILLAGGDAARALHSRVGRPRGVKDAGLLCRD